jgi:hypothetical protein
LLCQRRFTWAAFSVLFWQSKIYAYARGQHHVGQSGLLVVDPEAHARAQSGVPGFFLMFNDGVKDMFSARGTGGLWRFPCFYAMHTHHVDMRAKDGV